MSEQILKKQIIVYSDDSSVRATIIAALGERTASDRAPHVIHEFATAPALRSYVDSGFTLAQSAAKLLRGTTLLHA